MEGKAMEGTYHASLYVNNINIFYGFGDDLQALIARFTAILISENTQATIGIHNGQGDLVYQSRKVAEE
jgi:hypothetical protein